MVGQSKLVRNGSFDVVKDDDLRAKEWEIAPNAPDKCNVLHVFLSSMTDKEKELIITLCNKLLINANSQSSAVSASQC